MAEWRGKCFKVPMKRKFLLHFKVPMKRKFLLHHVKGLFKL